MRISVCHVTINVCLFWCFLSPFTLFGYSTLGLLYQIHFYSLESSTRLSGSRMFVDIARVDPRKCSYGIRHEGHQSACCEKERESEIQHGSPQCKSVYRETGRL